MTEPEFQFAHLRDPRLAAHALNPEPVWLWAVDASRLLWTNPNGAAIFDAESPGAATALRFHARHAAAAQIARLAGTLQQGSTPRLERLRGFGAGIGGTLICLCSRITLTDNTPAILVVSTERAGKDLALPERAHRLLESLQRPAAIFTADGELIEAQPSARERLGDKLDLVALGTEKLAREASLNGSAEGNSSAGRVGIIKVGAGATFALLISFIELEHPSSTAPEITEPPKVPEPADSKTSRPQRFVWQTDADGCFSLASPEFADLLGPSTVAVLNREWSEIAATLNLDPDGQIANALAARATFSDIVVLWPVDNSNERLPVELSGLPIFDRQRQFRGFRGFAVCRDASRLKDIQCPRQQPTTPSPSPAESESKVVPFPPNSPPVVAEPALNAREHSAFQELARELNERLKKPTAKAEAKTPIVDDEPPVPLAREMPKAGRDAQESRPIFDRLPVGILIYRLNNLIYANRAFLEWTGYSTLDALSEAGGLDSLLIEDKRTSTSKRKRSSSKTLTIATVNGKQKPVEGRLSSVIWNGENALLLVIDTHVTPVGSNETQTDPDIRRENRELKAILDTATDGVLVLDQAGRILSANRSAEALFGYEAAEFNGLSIENLLVPESRHAVLDHLDRLAQGGGTLDAGYEVIGRVRQGGLVPLHTTMGRIENGEKICAVLRDVTAWKRNEEELINARRAAEKASTAKSEFLAKISHEIRTPLNAIIGFSEVMMDERFGPIGSERYRQYLKDIHASGGHLISLLNDLLDLSKIEAGKLELTFVSVNLNDLVQQCVAIMQEQANRERVIIRTALPASLPQIIADARSMRQIVLNLLSNSIKFTGAGGQVIMSTALTDHQEVVLRVRDTGAGMTEKELQTALEPFRQVATVTHWDAIGTGLGLPITKALAEANHARFRITSQVDDGTLVELTFPTTRVLAQ
ncbi:MAG TPA: PAS domain S-box protein [Pseudolabrys sp.]|nr:PAS domain S-box protein [Pseudolabrys sp.]